MRETINKVGKFILWAVAIMLMINGAVYLIAKNQVENSVNNYSEESFKAEFMEGCDDGTLDGARFDQTQYCQCLWTEIRKNYEIKELGSDGLNLTEQEIATKYEKEIDLCLNTYTALN